MKRTAAPLSLVLFLSTISVLTGASAKACSSPADFHLVPGQGLSCSLDGRVWSVKLDDGSTVLTHGPDPKENPDEARGPADAAPRAPLPPRAPICATPSQSRTRVIYAVPADAEPGFTNFDKAQIQTDVAKMNAILHAEAQAFDREAAYRVLCESPGKPQVDHVVVNTPWAGSSFGAITSALRTLGYQSPLEKYLVIYDGNVNCSCSGQGSFIGDDRLIASNGNTNGPSYGLVYGTDATAFHVKVMMHENGHNLGAVQNSAPHSSGGAHCNDGKDIMCYADGGYKSQYGETSCISVERFDCNNDDYFNPAPAAGSYLATRWNLGSPLNPFFAFATQASPIASGTVSSAALDVRVESGPTPGTVRVSWLPPLSTGGATTAWRIYRDPLGGGAYPLIAETSIALGSNGRYSYIDTPPDVLFSSHYYWVTPMSTAGQGQEPVRAVWIAH